MKYTEKYLKSQGIILFSYNIEYTFGPRLLIQQKDGYLSTYSLSRNDIEDIKAGDMFGILDNLVDNHIITHKKYLRKIKLKLLNEIN